MSKDALIRAFHSSGAFKSDPNGGFTLASGQVSPFYVDCRTLMADPGARRLVAQLAWELIGRLELDCLGGLEIGAISIATFISDYAYGATPRKEWRTFVVRKQAKIMDWGSRSRASLNRRSRADRRRRPHQRGFGSQSRGGGAGSGPRCSERSRHR